MTTTSGNNTGSVAINTVQKTYYTPTVEASVLNVSGNSTTTVDKWAIGDSSFAYIRAKAVTFMVKGLKPNTQYYPFFNGVDVAAYCSTSDGLQTSAIVTDILGDVTGIFYIPANTFKSGSHIFSLVDNFKTVDTVKFPDPLYGSCEAIYEANGILKQQQSQVTTNVVDIQVPPITAPINQPNPPVVCESWYFNYTVTTSLTKEYSVITNSIVPPATAPKFGTGTASSTTGTYVRSEQVSAGKFAHYYSVSSFSNKQFFRQEWVGEEVANATELPWNSSGVITGFRPSGIATTAVVAITKEWTRVGNVACPVNFGLKTPKRVDPLAQSFFIEPETYPNGVYVTSISVYFRTVDQSTPVRIELRNMVNGVPGPSILPNGIVVLPGYSVGQSDDSSMPTKFTFDQPIYLQANTEYCFVLKSTSLGYNAWCSRFGEIDKIDGRVIDAQPFNGTLFKSENDSTWTPDQYEDIKFDLNIAQFDISKTGNMMFYQRVDSDKYFNTRQVLPISYIETTNSSKVVKIKIPLHGLKTNDKIFIEGLTAISYNNIPAADLSGEFTVTVASGDTDFVTITASGTTNANKTGRIVASDVLQTINTVLPTLPTEQTYATAEPYVNDGTNSPNTIPETPDAPTVPTVASSTNSTSFAVYTNIPVNEVMIDYLGAEPSGTEIVERIKATSDIYNKDSSYTIIDNNGDFYSYNDPKIIASKANETLNTVENSVDVNLTLSSASSDVSPVVDLNGMSLIVKSYRIDNQDDEITDLLADSNSVLSDFNDSTQNSEILAGKGNASAKYKSQVVQTAESYKTINLFVTGTSPSPAVIDAYVRISADPTTHSDRDWVWVPINGVFKTQFVHSVNKNTVNEWMYIYNSSEEFNVYDIKLVMRSTNSSIVPKIYGLRTILNK